jgi:ER lumen protein retaining receptor
VYLSRYLDLFWTAFIPSNAYNTIFKLVFIGTQGYIIYLMLHDYRPTHDPNLDTFKVEYLLAGAAVMGIVFPYKYNPSEVCWYGRHLELDTADHKIRCSGHFQYGWSQ